MNSRQLAQAFRAQSLHVRADLSGHTGVIISDTQNILVRLSGKKARQFVERVHLIVNAGLSSRDAIDACGAMTLQEHLQMTLNFIERPERVDNSSYYLDRNRKRRLPSYPCQQATLFEDHGRPELSDSTGLNQSDDILNDNLDLFGSPSDPSGDRICNRVPGAKL